MIEPLLYRHTETYGPHEHKICRPCVCLISFSYLLSFVLVPQQGKSILAFKCQTVIAAFPSGKLLHFTFLDGGIFMKSIFDSLILKTKQNECY